MREVVELADNEDAIVFPDVSNDQTMERLKAGTGSGPTIGTAPNRFTAKVPEDFDPGLVCAAVTEEWIRIANAVRAADLSGLSDKQLAIWDRQINNFWEIAWVMVPKAAGAKKDATDLLDRRKNWRTYMPEVECGDKCTVMGEMQELSGYHTPNSKEQDRLLWKELREHFIDNAQGLDLSEDVCEASVHVRPYLADTSTPMGTSL
jgi:CRISPR-associated protein Cmr2